uniref:FYR C-terminal domain-containing protein n=1 Tax=Syphacia muris TaxID=451379 RepID=A0A0N5AK52_9BILA
MDNTLVVEDCDSTEIICSDDGSLIKQPLTSGEEFNNKCTTCEIRHEQQDSSSNGGNFKKEMHKEFRIRKRPLEFSVVSRAEHKRWRQDIDGFAQYCEWEAKVNEPCTDDVSDFESTESVCSYDPAKEYYFKVTIPVTNDEELAEIYDFVDKMNQKIDEEEKKATQQNVDVKTQK